MKTISNLVIRYRWAILVSTIIMLIIMLTELEPQKAKADISGYSQVVMLELSYKPGDFLITARVHLASGTALIHKTQSEKESKRLLDIAQIFSNKGSRLFVDLEKDEIKSFQISVP